jgi:hypothetical protein
MMEPDEFDDSVQKGLLNKKETESELGEFIKGDDSQVQSEEIEGPEPKEGDPAMSQSQIDR